MNTCEIVSSSYPGLTQKAGTFVHTNIADLTEVSEIRRALEEIISLRVEVNDLRDQVRELELENYALGEMLESRDHSAELLSQALREMAENG